MRSPTYVLAAEYPTEPRLVHADLYRLSSPEQVEDLALLFVGNPGTLGDDRVGHRGKAVMHRFEEGLVVETWTSWDNLAVLTQLGLLRTVGM